MDSLTTKEKLFAIGRQEFLEHGFKDASLRNIVKKAGFTLGAFYGYYPSKKDLFEDIVKEAADSLYNSFFEVQKSFSSLTDEEQMKQMDSISSDGLKQMLDMIYEDIDVYRILFFRATGTSYENFLQKFIKVEVTATHQFIETLQRQGHQLDIDNALIHIISSSLLSSFLEVVEHDMSKERACKYIQQMREFHSAGWQELLGL